MSENELILVVDDDPELLEVHSLFVQSLGYGVVTASNGNEALALIGEHGENILLVLADVVMPVMDGYELCTALKGDFETEDLPFVFVSSLDTLEEKVKGFNVGADDFIVKPIDPGVLGHKLKRLLERRNKNKGLQQQLSETRNVAMSAMTYSSDLGQVLEFYKNTLNAHSFEDIATLLFDVTNNYGLHCTLQVVTPAKTLYFGHKGEVSPLEANVIELARTKGRFFDFGPRTLINYKEFSLLTKNMPVTDVERYGIVKDSLGNLCNAIEARVKFLLYQNATLQKEQIVSTVLGVLEQIDDAFSSVQKKNTKVIDRVIDELDDAMMDLGLMPSQEDRIRNIVLKGREESKRVLKEGVVLFDLFEKVRNQLDKVLDKVE